MVRRVDDGSDPDDYVPIVPFVPFRCPNCSRHKPFTYKVRGRLRYHKCQACGERYRSWEMDRGEGCPGWSAPADVSPQ